jgi:hypothetical protein
VPPAPALPVSSNERDLTGKVTEVSSKAIRDQRQDPFSRRLLSDRVHRRVFDELCQDGMPPKALESFLLAACYAAHARSKVPPILGDEVKTLPRELESCAKLIDSANQGAFAPSLHVREPYKKFYEVLPNIMRLYAATYRHLEHLANPLRHRRLTSARLRTIELLGVVVLYTGSPHYERLATLLTKGFAVAAEMYKINGKRSQAPLPAFFDAESLAKLYRSSADLMPSNLPRRSPAVRSLKQERNSP